ncbi:MAG: DNA repair protein RadC [Deltaproteobacteria bacterium]|nr:DNA repair protein RadC [Deltaproteobacteria bacterium]
MAQAQSLVFKDYPIQERPRERLFALGPQALSDSELIAILLRSGRSQVSAKDLALEILKQSSGLKGLLSLELSQLLKLSGIGPAKASTLLACLELSRRLLKEKFQRRSVIESAQDLFDYLHHDLAHRPQEQLLAVLLDAKLQVVKIMDLGHGSGQDLPFSLGGILRRILLEGSPGFILVHNHPSGDPRPSVMDRRMTKLVKKASETVELNLHDHIIIAQGGYFSFAEAGLL